MQNILQICHSEDIANVQKGANSQAIQCSGFYQIWLPPPSNIMVPSSHSSSYCPHYHSSGRVLETPNYMNKEGETFFIIIFFLNKKTIHSSPICQNLSIYLTPPPYKKTRSFTWTL